MVGPGEEASLNFWFQPDQSFPAREFQVHFLSASDDHCRSTFYANSGIQAYWMQTACTQAMQALKILP